MSAALPPLIQQYKADSESVYNTWFINNEERLKAFRSIRRGVQQVVKDIKAGSFGNDFKGTSLEFVLSVISEQKQVFQGAAHPFYWKPKLRIPDIYEHEDNKRAFGQFLESCLAATTEQQLLREIDILDRRKIKGLGPAVASILYFLHPTLMPPCNTAIVNGFNALFGEKIKLGSWSEYLRMRERLRDLNQEHRQHLSLDYGALSGLLFDVGVKKMIAGDQQFATDEDRDKYQQQAQKRHKEVQFEAQEENQHTEMQHHLLRVGKALGCDVTTAINDRNRLCGGQKLSFLCLDQHPELPVPADVASTIRLIDIVWFAPGTNRVVAAFEVEKSTSIYSGILRLTDLAFSMPEHETALYLVVPDAREKEVQAQLSRPAIRAAGATIRYILFSELRQHCEALCKFGDSPAAMLKIARSVS
jgi:type II restriction enzyme